MLLLTFCLHLLKFVYKIKKFFLHSFTFFELFFTLKKILHTSVDIFAYICYHRCIQNVNKKGYIMGMIRVSDDTAKKLKKIGDGRSMTAAINMLIERETEGRGEDVMEAINNLGEKIDAVERALKEMQAYKPEPAAYSELASYPAPDSVILPSQRSYPVQENEPDKTYDELLNEYKDVQKEYDELDDKDSERGKELANKMRAISVDLSLIDEE